MSNFQNDEDLIKSSLLEAQESAGFYEGDERVALGGLFNNVFFFSTLVSGGNEAD